MKWGLLERLPQNTYECKKKINSPSYAEVRSHISIISSAFSLLRLYIKLRKII